MGCGIVSRARVDLPSKSLVCRPCRREKRSQFVRLCFHHLHRLDFAFQGGMLRSCAYIRRNAMRAIRTLVALGFALVAVDAQAQTYPDRVIKLIAPNPAGGLGDLLLRTFGDFVTSKTGQPTVIENRAGASGNVAWESIARAVPDGYTIGLVNTGVVINRYTFKSLRYDLFDDLVPIAPIGDAPQLFFIHSQASAADLGRVRQLRQVAITQDDLRLGRHRLAAASCRRPARAPHRRSISGMCRTAEWRPRSPTSWLATSIRSRSRSARSVQRWTPAPCGHCSR